MRPGAGAEIIFIILIIIKSTVVSLEDARMKKNRNTGLNHQKFYCDFREQRYKNKCAFVTFVTRGFKKCSQEKLFSTPILTEWKSPLQILIIIKLTHDSLESM